MNTARLLTMALTVSVAASAAAFFGADGEAPAESPESTQTKAVVEATTAFLASLGDDQRQKAQFAFPGDQAPAAAKFARGGTKGGNKGGKDGGGKGKGGGMAFTGEKFGDSIWSNFPTSDVPRAGARLGDLNADQREAAMTVLRAVLSPRGYQKVIDIMGSDQVLADAGTPFDSGNDSYVIGVFGAPSATGPWMLQFGGHHLALNVVIAGGRGTVTPAMTGAQPSLYKSKDKVVRPLAGENDKAFALIEALDEKQRAKAVLNYKVGDLVVGPGHYGETISPEGLKGSEMDEGQRGKLLDIVSEWAGIVNDAFAKPRMDEIRTGLADTHFAWSGPTAREAGRNGSAYYRVQGPKVLIEFSPQGGGPGGPGAGGPTLHVHTVYRDPTNDYGRVPARK